MRPIVFGQHTQSKRKTVLSDEKMLPPSFFQSGGYHDELRLITYHDQETQKTLQFLTNNFALSASTIAAIYKARWHIELFFKWIKKLENQVFPGNQ